MQLTVLTTSITEPVTKEEVKVFLGYPSTETSQDSLITGMITAAREFVEAYTGLSVVSKSYKVQFDKEDALDGWYELPVSPVLASPAITANVSGTTTTFTQKGLSTVSIYPDNVIGTIGVGSSVLNYYFEVTFTAGATNTTANLCIMRIVAQVFNHREDGINISLSRLDFSTIKLLDSISKNV